MVSSKYELSHFGCLRGCMWAVCGRVSVGVCSNLIIGSQVRFRVRLESVFATREDQCSLNNEKSLFSSVLDCANIIISGRALRSEVGLLKELRSEVGLLKERGAKLQVSFLRLQFQFVPV